MSRYIGNYVGVPSTEPAQGSASGVWSLVEQLAYQRNNQWPPARDPYYNQTVLHLSGNIPNTSGPQAMNVPLAYNSDASSNNHLITPNGDVSPRPFSPYMGSNYSYYFDGNSYLRASPSSISSPTFTVECWFYYTGANNIQSTLFDFSGGVGGYGMYAGHNSSGQLSFQAFATNSNAPFIGTITSSASELYNKWAHFAVTFDASVYRMFVNGNLVATLTSSTQIATLGSMVIGARSDSAATQAWQGYISNLRYVTGVALYTTNFTPNITPLTIATSGTTRLLTCQSNRFVDNSTSPYTLAITGSPRVTDNSPFATTDWTTGSAYFDGASDYLSLPTNTATTLGNGNFTAEAWVYPDGTVSSTMQILGSWDGSTTLSWTLPIGTSRSITFGYATDGIYYPANTFSATNVITANAWNHVAVVRTSNTIIVYVNAITVINQTISGTFYNAPNNTKIGGNTNSQWLKGYIADARLVVGTSIYSGTSTTTPNFTLPTSPLQPVTNTQLLTLQTRAASQNHGFVDSSPNEFIVTRTGNVSQGTFSPFSPGGWSNYFSGSPAYLSGSGQLLGIGSNDFTVEAWVFLPYLDGVANRFILGTATTSSSPTGIYFSINPSGTIVSAETWGISVWTTTGITFTAGTWNHVALCRSGTTARVFLNGVPSTNTGTFSQSYNSTSFVIGRTWTTDAANSSYMIGNISNLRVISGQALYSTNFTPPSSPLTTTQVGSTGAGAASSITGTVTLLTCQDNRFRDNSSYNRTISIGDGTPQVQAFSPFRPTSTVQPLVTGGSAYFDGSSDYLYLNDADIFNFDTSPFTVECWVYPTTSVATGYYYVISKWRSAPNKEIIFGLASNNGTWSYLYTTDGSTDKLITDPTAIVSFCWTHYAVSRTANTISLFRNGVRVATTTETGSLYNTSGYGITIGAHEHDRTANFPGYVSGLRAVKGTAIYDATSSTITIPTAPPTPTQNTSLLLNFTGGGIVDATGRNNLETVGKVQIATAQAKWDFQRGGAALQFDGSGYLAYRNNPVNAFGTGDFTIELWVYHTSLSGQQTYFSDGFGASAGPYVYKDSSNLIGLYYSSQILTASSAIAANTWYHVAVVRQAGTVKLYIDGVQKASNPDTTNLTSPIQYVGNDGSSGAFSGYMTARVTNSARYTGSSTSTPNFTLPTGPFPIG